MNPVYLTPKTQSDILKVFVDQMERSRVSQECWVHHIWTVQSRVNGQLWENIRNE